MKPEIVFRPRARSVKAVSEPKKVKSAEKPQEADTPAILDSAPVTLVCDETPIIAFDKGAFMKTYMNDRREADRNGFGGSSDANHAKFNPAFKTVKQYRAHRESLTK